MPRDEILRRTKAVSQVLEALRNDHRQTLSSLQSDSAVDDLSSHGKIGAVSKSLEQLELGVSEAQVSIAPLLHRVSKKPCKIVSP